MRVVSAEAAVEVGKHILFVEFPFLAEGWIRGSSTN